MLHTAPDASDGSAPGGSTVPEATVWILLAAETVLWGALFWALVTVRGWQPGLWLEAQKQLDPESALVSTLLLFTGSLSATRAQAGLIRHDLERTRQWVCVALIIAGLFLSFRWLEWSHIVERWQSAHAVAGKRAFWGFFLLMTALHAVHLSAAAGRLAWWSLRLKRSSDASLPSRSLEPMVFGWHTASALWVILFAAFYLWRF
jgi:cytochrome c oxidase subunit 3